MIPIDIILEMKTKKAQSYLLLYVEIADFMKTIL